jgi:ABC-type enterochelin transport system substrate-binding protein
MAFSVTELDDRHIAIARKTAEVMKQMLTNQTFEEDKAWKESAISY